LVAGGSSGIGLATAQLLAADGAAVTITGRHEERLAAAHAALAARGHTVWALPCDSMVSADLAHAVSIAGGGGRLDIAVSVPGGPGTARPTAEVDDAEFMAVVDRNVRPVVLMVKHASAAMDGDGSIVVVSSTAAILSARGLASYAAAKAAVDALVRVAADELGARGVRVNSVRPGRTRTPGSPNGSDRRLAEATGASQPLGRPGEAGDVARAIRFLAGPESSWITGQSLAVDGGLSLRALPDATPGRRLPGR
jgi:NAD(P)-dependent dehydrogenase (short-subunit alcohol dehydrogenase family)